MNSPTISQRFKALKEHLLFRYMPPTANALANMATMRARQIIKERGPVRVLVDNTVLGNSITHETAWVSTGTKLWGGVHPVETGYSARVPVHAPDATSREYENVCFLTVIAHLARKGAVSLHLSAELKDEQFRQPMGRYSGYGYFDYGLFQGLKLESIDGFVLPTMGPSWMNIPSPAEQQRARLANKQDPLFEGLVRHLGQSSSQDAWHITTAERHGLYCFLTMDFKLIEAMERHAGKEPFASLKTKVMSPAQFGAEFELIKLPPHIFSYHDASWFVRPDLHMPGSKRRPRSGYAKSQN